MTQPSETEALDEGRQRGRGHPAKVPLPVAFPANAAQNLRQLHELCHSSSRASLSSTSKFFGSSFLLTSLQGPHVTPVSAGPRTIYTTWIVCHVDSGSAHPEFVCPHIGCILRTNIILPFLPAKRGHFCDLGPFWLVSHFEGPF